MRTQLINFLSKLDELKGVDVEKLLTKPKVETQGDFSLPCFTISKSLGNNPAQTSKNLQGKLSKSLPDFLEKVEAAGPFLNFYLDNKKQSKKILDYIFNDKFLDYKTSNPQKILIEYPSPNTNKSLHLGHTRNILLGNSISNIFEKVGHSVIKTCVNNDRGIALCKSMLGYKLFFADKTPQTEKMKPDEFVSMCYVKFGEEVKKDPTLDERAQDMLVKWEAQDKDTIQLWNKILAWVYEGYEITYKNYKLDFNNFSKVYHESQIYKDGKDIVLNAIKKKIAGFKKSDDGAIYYDFEDKTYGQKYLLRGDGTTLYMTQDLYLASLKEKQFKADKYIFIVGKEQKYHFEVLFKLLGVLGMGGVEKNLHFAYGYVYNENGEKFSSRKGDVIGADWILNETISRAKKNLLSKEISKDLKKAELERRANIIAYSALSFSFLKINPLSDINFSLDDALAFEGETGPYVQYTYARIQSIFRKAEMILDLELDYSLFNEKEISIIKTLNEYTTVLEDAATKYKPSSLAQYLIKLSQQFNEFYQSCQIIKEESRIQKNRLVLSYCIAKILKDGLNLLNIDVLDEM